MKSLDLFSGIGGFALAGARLGIETVAFCEIDPFCQAVLGKHWPGVPIYGDIRKLDPTGFRGVDLIAGGFPCQDISAAGKGAGIDGARSGLWKEMLRIIAGVRPHWCLIENVPALRTRGSDRVLSDLETVGYAAWPLVVGAWAVGAPHRRDRVWIVAHRGGDALREQSGRGSGAGWAGEAVAGDSGEGLADTHRGRREELGQQDRQPEHEGAPGREPDGCDGAGLADTDNERREEQRGTEPVHEGPGRTEPQRHSLWPARPGQQQHEWEEPRLIEFPLGGSTDGLPAGLVRTRRRNNREALKAYGNSIVPDVAEAILSVIVSL